jgi:hypothetical protein
VVPAYRAIRYRTRHAGRGSKRLDTTVRRRVPSTAIGTRLTARFAPDTEKVETAVRCANPVVVRAQTLSLA